MKFSTEGHRVSYTFCIFHKERKTSHQFIWLEIPLPRTFLNVIFHGGWQGDLHVRHFPQGEKIFTSIDLIKDPSSTNFPPCNFPQGVLHILHFPHREKVRTTLYCSFSISSKSLKKKRWILSLSHFFFFLLLNFFIVS